MIKFINAALAVSISLIVLISGCSGSQKFAGENQSKNQMQGTAQSSTSGQQQVQTSIPPVSTPVPTVVPTQMPVVDLAKVKLNEAGKVMVVMFHNFVEAFTPTTYDNGEYTTTFEEFRKLLASLYEKGYRLINVNDYLSNNISVPAGCIPMIFTFDDGTAGQFNLIEENGKFIVNPKSAVGIMEEFNKAHPDFGLKGTFYVNLGLKTFDGKGDVPQRLKYLMDKGFEIGNHTLTHINLSQTKEADKIIREVGGNQKKMLELIPGYKLNSFALPFGAASKELQEHVFRGEFDGVKYENFAVMLVGAGPTVSPVSKKSTPLAMSRVRATGMKQVDCDLAWWLKNLTRDDQYISDGDPNTVSVPKAKEAEVDNDRLKGKQLNLY